MAISVGLRALLAVGVCAALCSGCGMVTHNLIAQRARQWFLDNEQPQIGGAMISSHIDALQGGAPFPVRVCVVGFIDIL